MNLYQTLFKRFFDLIFSILLFVCFLPIFSVICILLFIVNQGSPFFKQERPGKNAQIFRVIKFKTMNDKVDSEGKLLSDRERLTKVGAFIRKTSLDEIPQLLNVIKGEMSFIGPRPLLKSYLPYYSPIEQKRHLVSPGITGLAQVNGRNNLHWNERLAYDVQYVENISFLMDLRIIFKTIKNIISSKDINIVPGEKMKNLDDERRNTN